MRTNQQGETMEENICLKILLPNSFARITIPKSTSMSSLLNQITTIHHLNASTHKIYIHGDDDNHVPYLANTPISQLNTDIIQIGPIVNEENKISPPKKEKVESQKEKNVKRPRSYVKAHFEGLRKCLAEFCDDMAATQSWSEHVRLRQKQRLGSDVKNMCSVRRRLVSERKDLTTLSRSAFKRDLTPLNRAIKKVKQWQPRIKVDRSSWFLNLLNLGFKPDYYTDLYEMPFNEGMFLSRNLRGSQIILRFLFTQIDCKRAISEFPEVPTRTSKEGLQFGIACGRWINEIVQTREKYGDFIISRDLWRILSEAGGNEFYQFLNSFSTIVCKIKQEHTVESKTEIDVVSDFDVTQVNSELQESTIPIINPWTGAEMIGEFGGPLLVDVPEYTWDKERMSPDGEEDDDLFGAVGGCLDPMEY